MNTDIRAALFVLGCGFIGILMAALEKVLHDEGIMVDEFVTGTITLPDLMAVTIIIWILIGAVLAVASR